MLYCICIIRSITQHVPFKINVSVNLLDSNPCYIYWKKKRKKKKEEEEEN